MPTFKHSGSLGDVIYSMPTIRALGGGILYLNPNKTYRMTLDKIEEMIPLLEQQSYIEKVKVWNGETTDYGLDSWRRRRKKRIGRHTIIDAHLDWFEISRSEKDKAWLTVDKPTECDVVFARSARHNNPMFGWKEVWSQFHNRAIFVGIEEEHKTFEEQTGKIPFIKTNNMLELARIIAGSKLFIGNQSLPYAIAEGLKVNSWLEISPTCANCVYHRDNLKHFRRFPDKN